MRLERGVNIVAHMEQCTRLNCLSDKEADATFVAKEGRRPCHCISSKELSTSWATHPMETRSASKPTSAIIGICSAGSGRVERQGTCSTSDRRDRYPGDILSRTPSTAEIGRQSLFLLDELGIKKVKFDKGGTVVSAQDGTRGYILSRTTESIAGRSPLCLWATSKRRMG